jgi:hypothetical protein
VKCACFSLVSAFSRAGATTAPTLRVIDLQPQWDTQRALQNREGGWYHHLLDNGVDKYATIPEE